jgi:hypothetical protein
MKQDGVGVTWLRLLSKDLGLWLIPRLYLPALYSGRGASRTVVSIASGSADKKGPSIEDEIAKSVVAGSACLSQRGDRQGQAASREGLVRDRLIIETNRTDLVTTVQKLMLNVGSEKAQSWHLVLHSGWYVTFQEKCGTFSHSRNVHLLPLRRIVYHILHTSPLLRSGSQGLQ